MYVLHILSKCRSGGYALLESVKDVGNSHKVLKQKRKADTEDTESMEHSKSYEGHDL